MFGGILRRLHDGQHLASLDEPGERDQGQTSRVGATRFHLTFEIQWLRSPRCASLMNPDRLIRVRSTLLVLCAIASAWALMLALTGGFVVTILSIRVSSRNPRNAVLIALLSGLAAWALPAPRDR
ncbi:MAG TPA: hypothetical protein VIX63_05380, partial [Vicinamibacterales bacterium]